MADVLEKPTKPSMSAKTRRALLGSIKKWEGIVAGTTIDRGRWNCPLCEEFIDGFCFDCPVRVVSERPFCKGTPYISWARFGYSNKTASWWFPRWLAQRELRFLRSLLPQDRKQWRKRKPK